MELNPTEMLFEVADKSGYRYEIVAKRSERGWSASVTLHSSSGACTASDAVGWLIDPARDLIRQLKAAGADR